MYEYMCAGVAEGWLYRKKKCQFLLIRMSCAYTQKHHRLCVLYDDGGDGGGLATPCAREPTLFVTVYPVSGTIIGCADLFKFVHHVYFATKFPIFFLFVIIIVVC